VPLWLSLGTSTPGNGLLSSIEVPQRQPRSAPHVRGDPIAVVAADRCSRRSGGQPRTRGQTRALSAQQEDATLARRFQPVFVSANAQRKGKFQRAMIIRLSISSPPSFS